MRYFPIFLDLKDRPVVVVGGGEDALRKIRLLLKTDARIAVIAPALHDELAANRASTGSPAATMPLCMDGAVLVYSADPALNETVTADARALRHSGQCRRQSAALHLHRAFDRRP